MDLVDKYNELFNKGSKAMRRGEHTNAIRFLEDALKYNPIGNDILCMIGICYQKLGLYQDSIPYFEKILEMDSNNDWKNMAYPSLILSHGHLGNLTQARIYYDQSLKSNNPETKKIAHYHMGRNYDFLLKSEESVKYYLKAVAIDPLFLMGWLYLGENYLFLGKKEEFRECIMKAKKIDPVFTEKHIEEIQGSILKMFGEFYLDQKIENQKDKISKIRMSELTKRIKSSYEESKTLTIENIIEDPMKVLKIRLAKGEIKREEYLEMKNLLES